MEDLRNNSVTLKLLQNQKVYKPLMCYLFMVTTDSNGLERKFSFSENDIISVEGNKANVYGINGAYAGKIMKVPFSEVSCTSVLRNDEMSIEKLDKEYSIANELYEGNISVPKPIGVFNVFNRESNGYFPCFAIHVVPSLSSTCCLLICPQIPGSNSKF